MIETDKTGKDARRGTTRLLRHIKQSEKYNHKERIKKLSAVNRASSSNEQDHEIMGCDVAEREDAPFATGNLPTKKIKLPRKQLHDECSGVDHVSVPRKLRSAMKKRNRESISPPFPDSKKLNHSTGVVESSKKIGVKKSKLNLKQGATNWSKHSVSGPITKDEEEVVETLYALAGMFPDSELDSETKLDNISLDASPSALPEAREHPTEVEERVGLKEDLNMSCLSITDEALNPASDVKKSLEETVKNKSLTRPNICEPIDFPICGTPLGDLDSSVARVNLHKMSIKHEEEKSPYSANFCFSPGPKQDNGISCSKLKQPIKSEIQMLERKPEVALELTTPVGNQSHQQRLLNDFNSYGPVLWPGLSSTVSSTYCHGPSSQSFAAKKPACLGTTTRRGPIQCDSSSGKVIKVSADRRSWKRCAAHIYISHLIRAIEMPESKESMQLPPNQLRPQEILKQGVLMTINDFNGIRNDINGITSASSLLNKTEKSSCEAKSANNFQQLWLHQDQSQPSVSSGAYTSQKQIFNFLSLSAGGGMIETNKSSDGVGNGFPPLAQLRVPYHAQNSTALPFSSSQAQHMSPYSDQPSAAAASQQAQVLRLPSHFSSPYCGPYASPKTLTKQQQQQQRLWSAQLAAQYRNNGNSTTMTQFPSWQGGRQDSAALMPYVSASPSTLEILAPKYPQIALQQQQQQFMGINLPDAGMKRQDHHLSFVYDETGVGFRAGGGALPLQLLCNERL